MEFIIGLREILQLYIVFLTAAGVPYGLTSNSNKPNPPAVYCNHRKRQWNSLFGNNSLRSNPFPPSQGLSGDEVGHDADPFAGLTLPLDVACGESCGVAGDDANVYEVTGGVGDQVVDVEIRVAADQRNVMRDAHAAAEQVREYGEKMPLPEDQPSGGSGGGFEQAVGEAADSFNSGVVLFHQDMAVEIPGMFDAIEEAIDSPFIVGLAFGRKDQCDLLVSMPEDFSGSVFAQSVVIHSD